jgi:hypothetical protein
MEEFEIDEEYQELQENEKYIKEEPDTEPTDYVIEIINNLMKYAKESNTNSRAEYNKKNIKYITNYIYNMLCRTYIFEDIFRYTIELYYILLTNHEFESKYEVLQSFEQGLHYVLGLYRLKEIQIDEDELLYRKKECIDVMNILDKPNIHHCLKETDTFLFVSIDKTDFFSYSYSAVCYSKEDFRKSISQEKMNYSCIKDDPRIYIKLPIGPGAINVYIPLLSALIILQSYKFIFYLVKQDVSYYDGFDETFRSKYCENDTNKTAPFMHLAICGGSKCVEKGWLGAETDVLNTYRENVKKYMNEKKKKEQESVPNRRTGRKKTPY